MVPRLVRAVSQHPVLDDDVCAACGAYHAPLPQVVGMRWRLQGLDATKTRPMAASGKVCHAPWQGLSSASTWDMRLAAPH